jgi:CMP-N-acetylneuraminic acid synthetase
MPWQRAVDIDTEDDWQLAEFLMQAQQQGLG